MATLAGKTILIVGGTSGIGFATAQAALASQAAHVKVASSSQAKVDDAVQRLKKAGQFVGTVTGAVVDAKSEASVKQLVESIEVDHLIWTSGDGVKHGFPNVDLADAKDQFDVRFWGTVIAAKYAKIKKGGSIILTLGTAHRNPRKGWSVVTGVLGSIEAVARGLAVDLAPIRVNAVAPGCTATEMWGNFPDDIRSAMFKMMSDTLLVKHVAQPQEIAEAYLFLMKCDFITGQTIVVDGGDLPA